MEEQDTGPRIVSRDAFNAKTSTANMSESEDEENCEDASGAAKDDSGSSSKKRTKTVKPWMTKELERAINKRKAAYRKYKKQPTPAKWEAYKVLRNKTTSEIREVKRNFYGEGQEGSQSGEKVTKKETTTDEKEESKCEEKVVKNESPCVKKESVSVKNESSSERRDSKPTKRELSGDGRATGRRDMDKKKAGPVIHVNKGRDKEGQTKNFAFVEFKHDISVPYARQLMGGLPLFGRPLRLQFRSGSKHSEQAPVNFGPMPVMPGPDFRGGNGLLGPGPGPGPGPRGMFPPPIHRSASAPFGLARGSPDFMGMRSPLIGNQSLSMPGQQYRPPGNVMTPRPGLGPSPGPGFQQGPMPNRREQYDDTPKTGLIRDSGPKGDLVPGMRHSLSSPLLSGQSSGRFDAQDRRNLDRFNSTDGRDPPAKFEQDRTGRSDDYSPEIRGRYNSPDMRNADRFGSADRRDIPSKYDQNRTGGLDNYSPDNRGRNVPHDRQRDNRDAFGGDDLDRNFSPRRDSPFDMDRSFSDSDRFDNRDRSGRERSEMNERRNRSDQRGRFGDIDQRSRYGDIDQRENACDNFEPGSQFERDREARFFARGREYRSDINTNSPNFSSDQERDYDYRRGRQGSDNSGSRDRYGQQDRFERDSQFDRDRGRDGGSSNRESRSEQSRRGRDQGHGRDRSGSRFEQDGRERREFQNEGSYRRSHHSGR